MRRTLNATWKHNFIDIFHHTTFCFFFHMSTCSRSRCWLQPVWAGVVNCWLNTLLRMCNSVFNILFSLCLHNYHASTCLILRIRLLPSGHDCVSVRASPVRCYVDRVLASVTSSNAQSPASQTSKNLLHHRQMLVIPWIMHNPMNHWLSLCASKVAVCKRNVASSYTLLDIFARIRHHGPNSNPQLSTLEMRSEGWSKFLFCLLVFWTCILKC